MATGRRTAPKVPCDPWRSSGQLKQLVTSLAVEISTYAPSSRPALTLFTLRGLAVLLRDCADTQTERAEALLLGVERAYAQPMRGKAIDLGERIALAEAAAWPRRACAVCEPWSRRAGCSSPCPSW